MRILDTRVCETLSGTQPSVGALRPTLTTRSTAPPSERAGDLDKYTQGQSTRDPFSHYEFMDDDEFLATINGVEEGAGINVSQGGTIMDGHHRWDELRRRVAAGRISPDTMIDVWRLGR